MRGVLITGGTGFLGHGLVEEFMARGYNRICIYSRDEFKQAEMARKFKRDERLRFFVGDVRDMDRLERALQGVQHVVHAAALKRIEVGHYNPDEMVKTNVQGSMNVIYAAQRAEVQTVVLTSTDKAFQPVSPYGYSKAMAESLFLAANSGGATRYRICRYGNVSGSTGSVIPTWRAMLKAGQRVTITDPQCTRFWMLRWQAAAMVADALEDDGPDLRIPDLPAYSLGDLAMAMGATDPEITGLAHWEKKHEAMDELHSSDRARRMSVPELIEQLRGVE